MSLKVGLATAIATAQQGEKALAISMFTDILQSDPENEIAWLWMSQLVDTDELRISCLIRVLLINPRHPAAKAGLSHLTGKTTTSIKDLYSMAMDAFWRGQVDFARHLFEILIEINPGDEKAWLWMSRVTRSIQERTQCLQKVVKINPNNMHARACLDRLKNSSRTKKNLGLKILFKALGIILIGSSFIVFLYLAGFFSPNPITEDSANLPIFTEPKTRKEPTPIVFEKEKEIIIPTIDESPEPVQKIEPGSLLIPKLGIDAVVVNVPLQEGMWDISSLGNQIGLLDSTGRMPGDDQAMVFIGHVTISAAEIGPFYETRFLESGDQLLYRWENIDYIYRVEEKSIISPKDVGTLFSYGGDTVLLVTCSNWSYNTQSYTNRAITRAVLVDQKLSNVDKLSTQEPSDFSS
jgi:LPXTG-site transpeptidase (sortase) family protein